MSSPIPIPDEPTRRFFSPECGDGWTAAYIGDDEHEVARNFRCWLEDCAPGDGDTMTITCRMMTQAQVDALPEI